MNESEQIFKKFLLKKKTRDFSLIDELINEELKQRDLLIESNFYVDGFEDLRLKFPLFKIGRKVGEAPRTETGELLKSEEREVFDKLIAGVKGDVVRDRLAFIQNVISGQDINFALDEAVSSLIVVDMLSGLLEDFEASSAGFLFEQFFAALFKGTTEGWGGVKAIPDAEVRAVALAHLGDEFEGVEEALLPLTPVSLKLRRPEKFLTGSFTNLLIYFLGKNKEAYEEQDSPEKLLHIYAEKVKGGRGTSRVDFFGFSLAGSASSFKLKIFNLGELLQDDPNKYKTLGAMANRYFDIAKSSKELRTIEKQKQEVEAHLYNFYDEAETLSASGEREGVEQVKKEIDKLKSTLEKLTKHKEELINRYGGEINVPPAQFKISSEAWRDKEDRRKFLGSLILDPQEISKRTQVLLGNTTSKIREIFHLLKTLTEQITFFYTDIENKPDHGYEAYEAAGKLKDAVDVETGRGSTNKL